MTTAKKSTTNPDVDALVSAPDEISLSSGAVVRIKRLRTLELLKLLKILTRGAGPILSTINWNAETPKDEFVAQLTALLISAIPEAEDQVIDFIQAMAEPKENWIERPATREQKAHNAELLADLYDELSNPEIEDTVSILSKVVENEAGDIQSLGKKLTLLFQTTRASIAAKNSSTRI